MDSSVQSNWRNTCILFVFPGSVNVFLKKLMLEWNFPIPFVNVCPMHTRCTYIQFKEVIRACPSISNFHDICSQLPGCLVSLTCILHIYGTSVSFVYVFISCCVSKQW